MSDSVQQSTESTGSCEPPVARRRRQTSAHSESLIGSYMTSRYPARFNSTSMSGRLVGQLQDSDSVEVLSGSLLLQMPEGTSWWAGVIIMTNCTIGMGLLNFPRAVHNAGGVANAMVLQVLVLLLIVASLYMVARCAQHYGCVSYQDMVTSHVGHVAGQACRLLIFLNNLGACIVILVVLGDQFEMLMNMIFDKDFCLHWYMRRRFFVPAVSACVILPLCLLKRFDFFKYISFLGVLAAVYIAFGVGLTRAITGIEGVAPVVQFASPITSQIITLIPLMCFAYECHVELPPMIACLKRQDMNYSMRLVIGYVVTSFLVYSIGGIGGYIALGEKVPGDFLLAYPRNDKLVIIAMALISMKGITTYPVIFYCVRSVVDDTWRRQVRRPRLLTREEPRRVAQTLVIVGLTVFVAIFVPSISVAIGLIGGVSSCFVFLFPGLCFMRMHLRQASAARASALLGAAFVVFGAFLLGSTSASAVVDFLQGGSEEPVLCE